MKIGIPPLIIGNWKMNPISETLAIKLGTELKKKLASLTNVEVVVAPPILYLERIHGIRNSKRSFHLGAQNVHHEKLGAHTGEISLPMLKQYEVTHIIVGHSERRASGETDAQVHQKVTAILKAGCVAVICVGEEKRDAHAHYLSHIETQVREALRGVPKNKLNQVVIAYEPIWAIGTGNNATPGDVHEMKLFIERVLTDLYGRNYAQKVRILYGGSVNAKNAKELFTEGMMDGFLVGGASLHADDFVSIAKATLYI